MPWPHGSDTNPTLLNSTLLAFLTTYITLKLSTTTKKLALLFHLMRFIMAIILLIFCKQVTPILGDIGTATCYNPPYTPTKCYGSRQDQFPPGNLFIAVSEGLWDNGAACGRRYRLRCLSGNNRPCKDGTIDVKVVDYCTKSPCPSTILMSNDAFASLSRSPDAKINIEFIQI